LRAGGHRTTVTRRLTAYRGPVTENVPDLTRPQVENLFEEKLREAFSQLGCFNLAVFGKTGVGKSTLVNAIFGQNVALTGVGRPVTRGLDYYRHPDGFLGLYDSEGFETGTSGDAILQGLTNVINEQRPDDQRIHAAWYLVRWSDRRFENAQQQFVRKIAALGVPEIMVITQVPSRDGAIHPEALEFADYIASLDLPLSPHGRAVLTNALEDPFTHTPVIGLRTLLDDTYEVIPEVAESALTAAQMLDMERKKKAVSRIVTQAAAIAAGIGAAPIPIADAALLVPNQITMISRITAAYGLPPNRSKALAAASSVILTGGATMAGKYAVTTLLRFLPGGFIVGSAISATVATALTKAVGMAWAQVCEYALSLPPDGRDTFLSSSAVTERFVEYLKHASRLIRP